MTANDPLATESPPLEDFRFGAIAVWGGLVSPQALEEALGEQRERQASGEPRRIGEMLVERGAMTAEQVQLVLRVQLQRMPAEGHLLFGRIAAAKRLVPGRGVDRALDVQSREILAGGGARRLGEILVAAGEMRPGDVDAILAYQASRDTVPMSEARKGAASAGSGRPEGEPKGGEAVAVLPDARGRKPPGYLPAGARRFVLDNSIWIACLAAALAAVLVALFRESLFG